MRLGLILGLAYLLFVAGMFFSQRTLIYPAPSGAAPLPSGFEAITLRTADGLNLPAAYRRAGAGQPTLVYFHGNGDSWTGSAAATALASDTSLGVLLSSYRGYSGNPGKPDEAGLYADGRAALDWLGAHGVPREKLVLIGNSLGSGVATQLAAESAPAALILVSPFTGMPELAAHHYPWLPARWLVLDRYDNRAKIGRVTAPVLILHGTSDSVIPVVQAQQLARGNARAQLLLFAGKEHDLAYLPEAQTAQAEWLTTIGLLPAR